MAQNLAKFSHYQSCKAIVSVFNGDKNLLSINLFEGNEQLENLFKKIESTFKSAMT